MLKSAIAVVACAVCALGGAVVGQAVTAARVVASPSDTGASLASLTPPSSAIAVRTVTATVGATRTAVVTRTAVTTVTRAAIAVPSPTLNTVTPTPRTAESSAPDVQQVSTSTTYYASCAAAKAAHAAPLHKSDPGYRAGLDRDGDGTACET